MPAANTQPPLVRLAICREDLGDGKEWSIFLLSDAGEPASATLMRASYELGDKGHSVAPGTTTDVEALASALIWREDWQGSELNLELTVRVSIGGQHTSLLFELGKLYRKRNPVQIERIGKAGWLHSPTYVSAG